MSGFTTELNETSYQLKQMRNSEEPSTRAEGRIWRAAASIDYPGPRDRNLLGKKNSDSA